MDSYNIGILVQQEIPENVVMDMQVALDSYLLARNHQLGPLHLVYFGGKDFAPQFVERARRHSAEYTILLQDNKESQWTYGQFPDARSVQSGAMTYLADIFLKETERLAVFHEYEVVDLTINMLELIYSKYGNVEEPLNLLYGDAYRRYVTETSEV